MALKYYTPGLYSLCVEVVRECQFCTSFFAFPKAIKSPRMEIELGLGTYYVDWKTLGTADGSLRYIMIVYHATTHYIILSLCRDRKAKTIANALFHDVLRYFHVDKLCSDNEGSLNSEVMEELRHLTNITPKFCNAYSPSAERAEEGVKKFSRVLKTVLSGNITEWRSKLAIVQIILNSTYRDPRTGFVPAMLNGQADGSLFYNPTLLFETHRTEELQAQWSAPMKTAAKVIQLLRQHYNTFLSVQRPHTKSLYTLELQRGSPVYFRVFAQPQSTPRGLHSMMPKFLVGSIKRLNGPTSAVIETPDGKIITRNISDIMPYYPSTRFASNEDWNLNAERYYRQERGEDLLERGIATKEQESDEKQQKSDSKDKRVARKNREPQPTERRRSERLKAKNTNQE